MRRIVVTGLSDLGPFPDPELEEITKDGFDLLCASSDMASYNMQLARLLNSVVPAVSQSYGSDFDRHEVTKDQCEKAFATMLNRHQVLARMLNSKMEMNCGEFYNHVSANSRLEVMVYRMCKHIWDTHKEKIYEIAKAIKQDSIPKTDDSKYEQEGVVTVKIHHSHIVPEQFSYIGTQPDRYHDMGLQHVIGTIAKEMMARYVAGAVSAATNHETRQTYAQQICDLTELYTMIFSEDAECEVISFIPLSMRSRSISAEADTVLRQSLLKQFLENNRNAMYKIFDTYQAFQGTRHPDGVIY